MEIEFLQEFISAQIPSPARYLFVRDPSSLLKDLQEILVQDRLYQVVYFENDLQLRSELEWTKTDGFDLNFCIISSKSDERTLAIQDFIHRATPLKITPQRLLNFIGESYWSEAANWLQGHDFWRCFDSLKRVKNRANLVPANADYTFLASALLGVNLSRRFDPVSGFIFYLKNMRSDTFQAFQQNYPQLAKFVNAKLFTEVPELKAFEENPALLDDFWGGHYESLPARLSNTGETEDLKYQMAIKAPGFVQEQIEAFETKYLQENEQIQEYLKSNRVTDSWDSWLEYLQHEKMLTAPVRLVLRKIVNYLLRNPGTVDFDALQSAMRILSQHQSLRRTGKSASRQDSMTELYSFFSDLVEIFVQIKQLQQYLEADLPEIIKTVYPEILARLTWQLNLLETAHQRAQFVEDVVIKKIAETITLLQLQFNSRFVRWIAENWQHPPLKLASQLELAPFPFQIIAANFREPDPKPVIVLLFDGMRWDGWELLSPHFAKLFPGQMSVKPMLTPLPGLTHVSRSYLLGGKFVEINEWQALKREFPDEKIEVYFYEDDLSNHRECLNLLLSAASIKFMIFNLFDRRIHHSRLSLTMLYREVETEFQEKILPILTQLPKNSKIIITSDHGFLQVTGKWFPQIEQKLALSPEYHRRFVKLPSHLADRQQFVFLNNEKLGEPVDSTSGFAFLKKPFVLKRQPNESYARYAHGGISLEEMIVPLVRVDYN